MRGAYRRLVCALALAAWPAVGCAQSAAPSDSLATPVARSQIAVIEQERLFLQTRYGKAMQASTDTARKALQAAEGLDPLNPWYPRWEAMAAIAQGNEGEAMRLAGRVDRIDPGFSYNGDAVAMVDSSMHAAGERVTGHEFHRTTVEFGDEQPPAWVFRGAGQATVHDGAVHGGVHAGYLHTHPAAHPHAVRRFVSAATKLAE